jgi:hypothetical protein
LLLAKFALRDRIAVVGKVHTFDEDARTVLELQLRLAVERRSLSLS